MGCKSSKAAYAAPDDFSRCASAADVIAKVRKDESEILDLSSAPSGSDTPCGLLQKLGIAMADVPDAAYECGSATSLSLKCNELRAVSPKVSRLTLLVTLDLSENSLADLPATLGALASLARLDVSENELTSLPAVIGKLTNLETLHAFKNKLKALPDELGNCARLSDLNVYNNKLAKLPPALSELENLVLVNVGANKLKTLPDVSNWGRVEELRLHQNSLISQFLPSFAGLAALKMLKLERNLALSELPKLGVHARLEAIECNNCSLEALPSAHDLAASLPALQYLTVHQNRLCELPPLRMAALTTLNAGGNPKLAAIPDLSGCPKLRVLFVDDCAIVQFHKRNAPESLPELERLIVGGNKLDEDAKVRIAAFVDLVTRNGGWIRGAEPPAAR